MKITQANNKLQIDCDGSVEEVYRRVERAQLKSSLSIPKRKELHNIVALVPAIPGRIRNEIFGPQYQKV